ncbi:MAG: hypothetical protein K8R36_08280, partial [Planctomycetales bacterium]|nr:hypothetical protein [Planctomycetales bacterium]
MGTSFVTLTKGSTGKEPGFWMRDEMLELWLRLLSLHLPEPNDYGEHVVTPEIRNSWLLASRGYFSGCVPHQMESACSTGAGRQAVRLAIDSLLTTLNRSDIPLDGKTLDLLGIEGFQFNDLSRDCLKDIARAFHDLLDDKIKSTA